MHWYYATSTRTVSGTVSNTNYDVLKLIQTRNEYRELETLTFRIICIEHVEWVYVKLKNLTISSSPQRITGSCKGPRVSFSNNGNLTQRYLGLPYFILWLIWEKFVRKLHILQHENKVVFQNSRKSLTSNMEMEIHNRTFFLITFCKNSVVCIYPTSRNQTVKEHIGHPLKPCTEY